LAVSPTNTTPSALAVTPFGPENEASIPKPSANDAAPSPASVVTWPIGVNLRIRLLLLSATRKLPLTSSKRCQGLLKDAEVGAPSAHAPLPVPANVDTTPASVIRRIMLFDVSAT
jgi:hypothetical protein